MFPVHHCTSILQFSIHVFLTSIKDFMILILFLVILNLKFILNGFFHFLFKRYDRKDTARQEQSGKLSLIVAVIVRQA